MESIIIKPKKRITNKQQRAKTFAKKEDQEKQKKLEAIEKAKIHEIMSKPITTKTLYDYMDVKKRV